MENTITWINTQGLKTVVKIPHTGYVVSVDGKKVAEVMGFGPVPAAAAAKAAQLGVVAFLGTVAITAARKTDIEALRMALYPPAAPAYKAPAALTDLEYALTYAHEVVQAHHSNPAIAYAAESKARAALDAWKAANQAAWAAVQAARKAARDAHKAQVSQSFAARNID